MDSITRSRKSREYGFGIVPPEIESMPSDSLINKSLGILPDSTRAENALVLLSQKAAFKVFENHLWRRFPLEHRGLGWVSTKRRTLNRGSRAMSRGLSA